MMSDENPAEANRGRAGAASTDRRWHRRGIAGGPSAAGHCRRHNAGADLGRRLFRHLDLRP